MTRPIRLEWTQDLTGEPAFVWPWVSDTNRMNRLAGLNPVTYTTRKGPDGKPQRIGASKVAGLTQSWDEHPFTWSFPDHFRVRRTFHGGLVAAYTSTVTLTEHDGGTRLRHVVELHPRAAMLRPVVALAARSTEAGWRKAYAAVAAHLFAKAPDPFDIPPDSLNELLRDIVTTIERDLIERGYPAQLVERLVALVTTGDALEVQHLRPYALADQWGAPRDQFLTLCLDAVRASLLEPRWSHLCPHCRGPKAAAASLTDLAVEARCDDCDLNFSGTFDSTIELAFRPATLIRPLAEQTSYCVAGPGATPHIGFQGLIQPGTVETLSLPVVPGVYRLRGPWGAFVGRIMYRQADQAAEPVSVDVGAAAPPPDTKPSGRTLEIALTHTGPVPVPFVIERGAWDEQAVTAAAVAALPAFKAALGAAALAAEAEFVAEALTMVALRPAANAGPGWYDDARWALERAGGLLAHDAPDELVAAYFDPQMALDVALDLAAPLVPDSPPCHVGAERGGCTATGPGLRYIGPAVDRARKAAELAAPGAPVFGRGLVSARPARLMLEAGDEWHVASETEGDYSVLRAT